MKQDDFQKAMEAIGKANIHIAGDFVMEKHVGTEIANVNVESGGTVNVAGGLDDIESLTNSPTQDNEQKQDNHEELFHFIHPTIDTKDEWRIHEEVKRLVRRNGIQEICQYLLQMKRDNKILLPQSLSVAYNELVRMGMPNKEGFNERTFQKYYRRC